MTSYVRNMPVLHYMKLNFFNTRCFSIISHLATRTDTNFLTTLEIENVAPEVLRRHGLHAWKHDIVDARQRHPQKDPIGQWDGVLVHDQHVLDHAEDEDLDHPGGKVPHGRDRVLPLPRAGQLGLVREAQSDVLLVVLVHVREYDDIEYELEHVEDEAGRECHAGEDGRGEVSPAAWRWLQVSEEENFRCPYRCFDGVADAKQERQRKRHAAYAANQPFPSDHEHNVVKLDAKYPVGE